MLLRLKFYNLYNSIIRLQNCQASTRFYFIARMFQSNEETNTEKTNKIVECLITLFIEKRIVVSFLRLNLFYNLIICQLVRTLWWNVIQQILPLFRRDEYIFCHFYLSRCIINRMIGVKRCENGSNEKKDKGQLSSF